MKVYKKNNRHFLVILFTFYSYFFTANLWANKSMMSEGDLYGIKVLSNDITKWIEENQSQSAKIGIYKVDIDNTISREFSTAIEYGIINQVQKSGTISIVQCFECRKPHMEIDGDMVKVSKGVVSTENLKKYADKLGVSSFLFAEAYLTKMSLHTQVKLVDPYSNKVVTSDWFQVPVFTLFDMPLLILTKFGTGIDFGKDKSGADESVPFFANISFLQDIMFGKGGAAITAGIAQDDFLIGLTPTIGVGDRIGRSFSFYLLTFGLGLGYFSDIAFTGNMGLNVMFGSFAGLSLDAAYYQDFSGADKKGGGYAGLSVVFAFGR